MPKSRKRRFTLKSKSASPRKTQGVSGDPSKRPAAPAPDRNERLLLASTLLRKAAAMPLADPIGFAALPALTRHALRLQGLGAPAPANCVAECLLLAHAYAELGIEAHVRVAELTVTDGKTGAQAVHGIPRPHWEEDRFYGHTVLWLPRYRHLIDPDAERYHEIAAWKAGPVVAAAGPADPERPDHGEIGITVTRGYLTLSYALGPREATAGVLADPVVHTARDGAWDEGANIASEVIWLLASERTAADTIVIPYPRAVALIDAVRDLDRRGAVGEDVYFVRRGALPGTEPVRISQIPLPDGTPEAAAPVG